MKAADVMVTDVIAFDLRIRCRQPPRCSWTRKSRRASHQ